MSLLTLLLYSVVSSTVAQGKSSCNPVSFDHLKIQVTEANFTNCEECRQRELQGGRITTAPSLLIPARRCFEQAINQSVKRHRTCKEGRPPSKRVDRNPCPTENYISQTAQAFYDVTQCLNIEAPEYLFAMINRESKFHITAESGTGASCYGQLTGIAIEDVNRLIKKRKPYNNDQKSCETVVQHFQPLPVKKKGGRYRKTGTALCRLHSNPYSCLAYSAIYYKETLKQAKRLIHRMDLILVTMKGSKKQMIFRDQDHFDNYFATTDQGKIASTARISLVKDKDLVAQTIALAGYNGGPGKVRGLFKSFMNNVKGGLWNPSSQKTVLSMLFSKTPWGIPNGDFVNEFSKHLSVQYKEETAKYAKHVFTEYEDISKGLAPACGVIPAKDALQPEGQFYGI